jgi:hypothetical protein
MLSCVSLRVDSLAFKASSVYDMLSVGSGQVFVDNFGQRQRDSNSQCY